MVILWDQVASFIIQPLIHLAEQGSLLAGSQILLAVVSVAVAVSVMVHRGDATLPSHPLALHNRLFPLLLLALHPHHHLNLDPQPCVDSM